MLDDIEFFGPADRIDKHPRGDIASEYPGWYNRVQMEEMQEAIDRDARTLEAGSVPPEHRAEFIQNLKRSKERLAEIQKAIPKLDGKQKDGLAKLRGDLGSQIQDSMFSYSEMVKGLASPHEEARRMAQPIISVGKGFEKVLTNMGVRVVDGKVSRNGASKAFKIIGRLLGEETNVEHLRRDSNPGSYRRDVPLAELIKEG